LLYAALSHAELGHGNAPAEVESEVNLRVHNVQYTVLYLEAICSRKHSIQFTEGQELCSNLFLHAMWQQRPQLLGCSNFSASAWALQTLFFSNNLGIVLGMKTIILVSLLIKSQG
jgi:hypothetical protein